MKNPILLSLSFLLLISCGNASKTTKSSSEAANPTVFEDQYYQDLGKNIVRLHHLMQGTFTAYSEEAAEKLKSWNVTGGDSVVLVSVPLGEVAKHGYWLYSYEMMTSLPNDPIYTTVKEIRMLSRDSFEVLHYKVNEKITLKEVLDSKVLNSKILIDKLVSTDKKTLFVRQTASSFIGSSILYEDEQCKCMRQNIYDLNPYRYNVEAKFYDKKTNQELQKEKRPNVLVRRLMNKKTLDQIAAKDDEKEKKK